MGIEHLLKGGSNNSTQLWSTSHRPKPDEESGLFLSIPSPQSGSFSVVALSSCGERIAAADRRGNIFLFDLKDNQGSLLHRSGRGVIDILFAEPTDIIIALNDSTIRVVNRSDSFAKLIVYHLILRTGSCLNLCEQQEQDCGGNAFAIPCATWLSRTSSFRRHSFQLC